MKIILKFFRAIAIVPVFFSCNINIQTKEDLELSVDDLRKTDLDFSKMSADSGMGTAFIHFADTGVFKLREGRLPLVGKDELVRAFSAPPALHFMLTWSPVKVGVAKSNDLGYTIGDWQMHTKTARGTDTLLYGNYLSVWKKQPDGSWKYVSDAGSNTPDPNKK